MAEKRRDPKVAGAILAGGKASRLGGQSKCLTRPNPKDSAIEKEIREMSAAGIHQIVIVANDPEPYRPLGRPIITDLRPNLGPLGGIEAALSYYQGRFDATLILPCDLPHITVREIVSLLEGFAEREANVAVAVSGESDWEPLCAVVKNNFLPVVRAAIDRGVSKVREVWKELGPVLIHFPDPRPFFNVNTPGDLSRWMAEKETGDCAPEIRRA